MVSTSSRAAVVSLPNHSRSASDDVHGNIASWFEAFHVETAERVAPGALHQGRTRTSPPGLPLEALAKWGGRGLKGRGFCTPLPNPLPMGDGVRVLHELPARDVLALLPAFRQVLEFVDALRHAPVVFVP